MKNFLLLLSVWAFFALFPILFLTGFSAFVEMDPSLFNPANWFEEARAFAGVWVGVVTAATFAAAAELCTN